MPQLVLSDFVPQLVWLAITFVALYLLLSRIALPGIGRILAEREARLKTDLARAERLKSDAETTLAAYRKAIADAQARAEGEIRDAAAQMAAEASRREAALSAEIAARTKAAETGIVEAKNRALGELRTVASEAARDLVARLSGSQPESGELAEAIAAAAGERS
jgi:F-type H+-transporting ATPase subunit b